MFWGPAPLPPGAAAGAAGAVGAVGAAVEAAEWAAAVAGSKPLSAAARKHRRSVPFFPSGLYPVTAGSTTLPAGTYGFTEDRTGVMIISSLDGHKAIAVLTNPEAGGNGSETSSVKFDKVNGQYALTEVTMAGEPAHRLIRLDEKSANFSSRLGVTNATAKSLR